MLGQTINKEDQVATADPEVGYLGCTIRSICAIRERVAGSVLGTKCLVQTVNAGLQD